MSTPAANSYAGTILIVDDSADWRTRVREILEGQPELHIVGEACDGLEGVQKAAELYPDVVLLDIGMPVLNGIHAAERIRKARTVCRIVFLTQDNDADIRSAAVNAGAEGYVLKVNAATELVSAIATALSNGRRRKETGTPS